MAKTAIRRHNTEKLQKKWDALLKVSDPDRNRQCLSFGRIFSRDPLDCGNPRCQVCSPDKVLHPKRNRAAVRKLERSALQSLEELE